MLSAVDHYGNELSNRDKEKLMQRCEKAPDFLRGDAGRFQGCETNDHMDKPSGAKQGRVCVSDGSFADIMKQTVRELEKKYFYG